MTLKRLRMYSTLAAVALWAIVAIDYSVPGPIDRLGKIKGTDFLQFYVAGLFVREGQPARLYDFHAYHARGREIAPTTQDVVYLPVQSPQTALAMAPLTALPYTGALAVWTALLAALYAASCAMLWASVPRLREYRREVVACSVAFPGFYSTVLHGQLSAVTLAAVCAAIVALRHRRLFIAGLALGSLAFKPHWVLAAAVVFGAAREWRLLAGVVVAAAAQIAATSFAVGVAAMTAYAGVLRSIGTIGELLEPRAGYSLRSLCTLFIPWPATAAAVYVLGAVAILVVAAGIWRSGSRFEVRASAAVLAMLLVNPHVFEYDLLLLTPVFFMLAETMAANAHPAPDSLQWPLAVLYVMPLLIAVPGAIRAPLSVAAMGAVLYTLRRPSRRPAAAVVAMG